MVSWSVETLLLALYVIAILCAGYIAIRAFQQSLVWGIVFLIAPVGFWLLSGVAGFLIAGLAVIAAQLYYVWQPYNWKTWGRIYVYMVLCWAGATTIRARDAGWQFVPFAIGGGGAVEQAGTGLPAAVESHLAVDGGRIWYRQSGAPGGLPVVLVHGGPGAGSFALKPLEVLGDERPVVRYDQLGAGRADRATDTALFVVSRFVGELDSLRAALGYERMHVVGHSWGAAVALEYQRAHPARVASLTLASPLVSARDWMASTRRLVGTLSETAQRAISESEASMDYDSPDYLAAVAEFNDRYVALRPDAAHQDSARRAFGRGQYHYMWGPSEFTVTGTLRSYDATRRLRRIDVPSLFLVGERDEADTALVRRYAGLAKGARFAIIPDAAHILTWDNPHETTRLIREFLRDVETPTTDSAARAP